MLSSSWQRCLVHFMRNALAHVPRRQHQMVAALIRTAYVQESQEQASGQWRESARMKSSELLERISTNPSICHGKPCIRGLRYPVDMILGLLSAGMTSEEILADYDDLEPEDILAVLAYAARLSQVKRIQAVA